jgi:hypothetical protein
MEAGIDSRGDCSGGEGRRGLGGCRSFLTEEKRDDSCCENEGGIEDGLGWEGGGDTFDSDDIERDSCKEPEIESSGSSNLPSSLKMRLRNSSASTFSSVSVQPLRKPCMNSLNVCLPISTVPP